MVADLDHVARSPLRMVASPKVRRLSKPQALFYASGHSRSVVCPLSSSLSRVDSAKAVPYSRRGAGEQHADIPQLLMLAVERDARQGGKMIAMLGKITSGRVVTAVLKPSSEAMRNSRGPAEVGSPTG
jgi:hypothetical protein